MARGVGKRKEIVVGLCLELYLISGTEIHEYMKSSNEQYHAKFENGICGLKF